MLLVLRCPPVLELSSGIKLRATIIESMAELVADSRTDGAVVVRSIRFRIEKRRLQNCCGEVKSILKRQVQCIYGLRSHPPFPAINGAIELSELLMIFPLARAPGIA